MKSFKLLERKQSYGKAGADRGVEGDPGKPAGSDFEEDPAVKVPSGGAKLGDPREVC